MKVFGFSDCRWYEGQDRGTSAAICGRSGGDLVQTDRIVNVEKHTQMLVHSVIASRKCVCQWLHFCFQDPKHTVGALKASPGLSVRDLSALKAVWDHFGRDW